MTLQNDSRRPIGWLSATTLAESIGDGISRQVLPIVAVSVLGAGAGLVGLLNSVGLAAFLLLSFPIGVLADRTGAPLRLMSLGSLTRAAMAVVGLLLYAAGALTGWGGMVALVTIAAVIGIADVVFTSGQGLLVPRLVEPDRIRSVYGRMQAFSQAGGAAAPLAARRPSVSSNRRSSWRQRRSAPPPSLGESPGEIDGVPIPAGGCDGASRRELGIDDPGKSTYGSGQRLWIEGHLQLQASSEYRQVSDEWVACMAEDGYRVTDVLEDQGDIKATRDARKAAGDGGPSVPQPRARWHWPWRTSIARSGSTSSSA